MESHLSTVSKEKIDTWFKAFKLNLHFTLLWKGFEVAVWICLNIPHQSWARHTAAVPATGG